jgi:hypothetical protein
MGESIEQIRKTNAEMAKNRDRVYEKFAHKIKHTEELHSLLHRRINIIQSCSEHSEWSIKNLRVCLDALTQPTETCKQRLALRQKRPKREFVLDPFQEALLAEQKELFNAKARLHDAIAHSVNIANSLKHMSDELEADSQDKAHALQVDNLCISKKFIAASASSSKLDKVYHRSPGPIHAEIATITRNGAPLAASASSEGFEQEKNRQLATMQLIDDAVSLERQAKERWQASSDTMDLTSKATATAFRATQAAMGAKIEHTELLRQELTKQCTLVAKKIANMRKCLGLTCDKINLIEKPKNANCQRTKIRSGRVFREATFDEASEALGAQQSTLLSEQCDLKDKVGDMRVALKELEAAHAQLVSDIQAKDQALAIDRQCASCRKIADQNMSFGFAKIGQGQQHFSETASSMTRQYRPISARHLFPCVAR